jgi:hypothetical protein
MDGVLVRRNLYVHQEKGESSDESDAYDPKLIVRVERRRQSRQSSKSDKKKNQGSKTRIRMSGKSSCIRGLGPLPSQN